ncbi:hypothetical protein Ahy_A01g003741 [Arachis hypogaea]|uniref:Uncharacterized protein n=1 Tax=Arachis hypogaea TaxID=3818 RepID=A0A445EU99_ARAHY|nr:hypothetical protein Ahy_A01g003741 [Arachis hypogaea]
MDSGSEGNSDFSGQWTDGWSSESEEEEEEVSKGLESPSRVGKDSEPVERVDVFGERDVGGRMPSSESPRGSGDQMSDDVDTSMLSTAAALANAEFHGVEEAYARYVEYAKAAGFAVRKGDSIKDDEGNVVRKFFYCNRQGLREKKHYERADRKRAHKAETRTNCSAKFVVFLDKQSGKWRTKTFVQDHNHDLTLPAFTNVMAAHRNINEGDKAHIHSMHEAGFQTNQIMGFFSYLSGGYRNLHFIKKDVYNYIDDVRRSRIVQGDAAAAINMVAAFGLQENEWIWATYEKREHWANAYLCDTFCAGLRTTSRCEGINASLKRFIKSSNCLLELVENLERVVKDYRNNEFIADYKSLYSEPVITTGLESIERAMSQIYTREIFFEVKKQIEGVAALIVLHRESYGSTEKFMFRKFHAKSGSFHDSDGGLDSNRAFRGRYGSLWTSCLPMCLLAAQRPATYKYAAAKIAQLLKEIEAEVSKGNRSTFVHDTVDGADILDPKIIKSKGAPRSTGNGKMARRCRRCHGFGHDRRNCTANKEDMLDEVRVKFKVVIGSVTV